ncbi:MAG: hypothetical protein ACHQLQ_04095 [Candidatus Acidiferrales bacterium]
MQDLADVNQESYSQQNSEGFVEKEDGAKPSHSAGEGLRPTGLAKSKGQASQSQPEKGRKQDGMQKSLAWRKSAVVAGRPLVQAHRSTSLRLTGSIRLTVQCTFVPFYHGAHKPENRVQAEEAKNGQH